MKRFMMTVAALAITAGTAMAASTDEMRETVDQRINEYAPEVEVETLTDEQVKQVFIILNDGNASPAETTGAIHEIIEGTAAEYYADLADGEIDLTLPADGMREQLQTALDTRNFDEDVSELSDEEVYSLAMTFNSAASPAELNRAVASAFDS